MGELANPPLIEAIFELHWGKLNRAEQDGAQVIEYPQEDAGLFPGQFASTAASEGYTFVEKVNRERPPLPFGIAYRFRRAAETWPCYQIGLGIFTVNQVSDGYKWENFLDTIQAGLEILDKSHPLHLSGLPPLQAELRYQDAFVLDKAESASDFLSKKSELSFTVPKLLMESSHIANNIEGHAIEFRAALSKPLGHLIVRLEQALINGQPGFVMNTVVRSRGQQAPLFAADALRIWADEAHEIQRHAFKTLINPSYMRKFK
jgi:uncharacterized protein (TIGR04255 family)